MKTQELETKLAAFSQGAQAVQAPNPDAFAFGDSDPEYVRQAIAYGVQQETARIQQEAEVRQTTEHFRKRLDEVLASGEKKYPGFTRMTQETHYPPELARQVVESDSAVDIAYFLGNNIDELRKLSGANPATQARMIGRLEERFSAASAAKKRRTSAPAALGTSQAPAKSGDEAKYGPSNLDDFDAVFFGRK